ncbi:MAG TPA: HAD-IC family P-type ATPase [Candidatus Eisenbacteria bacterium]|nr:HAD-IC family P-type ATPase [Candidatus Eisenbacteria bacterium]
MVNIHAQSIEEAIAALKTDAERGLTAAVARARFEEKGPNELPQDARPSVFLLFLKQFQNGLTYVLFCAAALSFFVDQMNDGLGIIVAVLIDAIVGFVQERRAERALEKLREMVVQESSVMRDGRVHRVPARELVPGDILMLTEGDRVTADSRLIECRELAANESSLTGESSSVEKDAAPVAPEASLADRRDMVWMGTSVVSGHGKAVVVETGRRTAFGRIAVSLSDIKRGRTPLESQLDRLGRRLGLLAIILSAVVFVAGSARGFAAVDMFFFAVALMVSVVPEGLPAVLAIVLAIGVQRMAKRNALVRHVPSVETLGAATVICTDKTGTLTENKMTVRGIVTAERELAVSGEGWEISGHFSDGGKRVRPAELPDARELLEAVALCNKSTLEVRDGRPSVVGDPTEGALAVVAAKAGIERRVLEKDLTLLDEVPFSSLRKYRAVLEERQEGGQRERIAYVVGAFEVIWGRSASVAAAGAARPADAAAFKHFETANDRMAGGAMRVLGVAMRRMGPGKGALADGDVRDLTFLGLVGMIDPPRQGVAKAIKRCKRAGVRVIMVTGDHKATALAIAKEIGLVSRNDDGRGVFTDADVAGLDETAFREALKGATVFARVAPETKLRIVSALKKEGHVVAMTGDGVNDAPALKKASIGVAMGITGTDVTKEVADMVLADDNFVTIVNAIEEGRIVYRNIKQTTAYLFMTNIGEVVTIVACLAAGLPLPLLPAQILWMNLVTDGLPDMALATEPTSDDVLAGPPRRGNAPILTKSIVGLTMVTALCMCLGTIELFTTALAAHGLKYARSVAFTALAVSQLWNVFSMRSATASVFKLGLFSNLFVFWAVTISLSLQLAVLYVPTLQQLFGTVPLELDEWLRIVVITSSVFFAVEIYKWLCRKRVIPESWL